MNDHERELARDRVGKWPRDEIRAVTRMRPEEAELIGLASALLGITPSAPPKRAILIDLRRKR